MHALALGPTAKSQLSNRAKVAPKEAFFWPPYLIYDNDNHVCVKVEQESYLHLEKYPYTGAQNCSQRSHSVHLKLNI